MSVRAVLYNDSPSRKMSGTVSTVRIAKSWATKHGVRHLKTELAESEGFKEQWWIKEARDWREVSWEEFFGEAS